MFSCEFESSSIMNDHIPMFPVCSCRFDCFLKPILRTDAESHINKQSVLLDQSNLGDLAIALAQNDNR